jgi:hypothetical protein
MIDFRDSEKSIFRLLKVKPNPKEAIPKKGQKVQKFDWAGI